MTRLVKCIECGTEFETQRGGRFCSECRVARIRKSKRRWAADNVGKCRENWDKWYAEKIKAPPYVHIKCFRCGHIFEAKTRKAKFCETCKLEKKRENTREWKRRNPELVKEQKKRYKQKR